MKERACKECKRLTRLDICEICRSPTSESWLGYVHIINPEKSEIAEKLGIKMPGRYALRVR